MLEAFFWGLVAASSLLLGALLALKFSFRQRAIGFAMAFAAGALIGAVAYELVEVAVQEYDATGAALGLFAGAIVFFGGDVLLTRKGAADRKMSAGARQGASALPIVLGIVLDGIPESAVLGLTLIEGSISVPMLAAVFISNLPEALAATTGLQRGGWPARHLAMLWVAVLLVSAVAAALGFALFDTASERVLAFVLAFAGGAILTMLADTMMPEAYEDSGPVVGLLTTLGFAVAVGLQGLE